MRPAATAAKRTLTLDISVPPGSLTTPGLCADRASGTTAVCALTRSAYLRAGCSGGTLARRDFDDRAGPGARGPARGAAGAVQAAGDQPAAGRLDRRTADHRRPVAAAPGGPASAAEDTGPGRGPAEGRQHPLRLADQPAEHRHPRPGPDLPDRAPAAGRGFRHPVGRARLHQRDRWAALSRTP